jgi:hypothetical protein
VVKCKDHVCILHASLLQTPTSITPIIAINYLDLQEYLAKNLQVPRGVGLHHQQVQGLHLEDQTLAEFVIKPQ